MKTSISLLLPLALAARLTACRSDDDNSSRSTSSSSSSVPAASSSSSSNSSTSSADSSRSSAAALEKTSLNFIGRYGTGAFDEAAAEIPAFDPASQRAFIVNAQEG